jgi:small subunit ribosomal protein S3e
VFFAELNEMLTRELAEDGYSGVEVRVTPMRTEIIIRATRTQNVLGMCASTTPILITAVITLGF